MQPSTKKFAPLLRTLIEVGFILFLFYSNLLMGEYTNSGLGRNKGVLWAAADIFTWNNFIIGLVLGLIGHLIFDFVRKRF